MKVSENLTKVHYNWLENYKS